MLAIAQAKSNKYEPLSLAARITIAFVGFVLLQLASPIKDYNYINLYKDFSLLVTPVICETTEVSETAVLPMEPTLVKEGILDTNKTTEVAVALLGSGPQEVLKPAGVKLAGTKQSKDLFTPLPVTLAKASEGEEIAIVKVESNKIVKQLPVWPVKGKISSPFGMRFHPIMKVNRFHNGIDIKAWYGTPIVAPVDGTVITAGYNGAFGRLVKLKTETGNKTLLFGHMQRIRCKVGQKVTKGQQIGTVGSSGRSTGPHLHFGVMDSQKKYINPMNFLNP